MLQVLDFYSLEGDQAWAEVGFESIFLVAFFLMAWAALAFIRHQKR